MKKFKVIVRGINRGKNEYEIICKDREQAIFLAGAAIGWANPVSFEIQVLEIVNNG